MINKGLANSLIDTTLEYGCEFVELFYEEGVKTYIDVTNGEVKQCNSIPSCGLGIRAFSNSSCVYTAVNDLSEENLFSVAKEVGITSKKKLMFQCL